MKNAIMSNGLRRTLGQTRYVSPVMPGTADGLVATVYAQAEKDFGMVAPPLALHSPAPPLLAASWAMIRETLVVAGQADRAEKEVVAAAVSVANTCPFCIAVHTAAVQGVVPGLDAADVASGNLPSPLLKEIFGWARATGLRGAVQSPPPGNFAELAGVAVTFQYLNRMVNIFLPDSPLPPMTPKAIGGWVMGMIASAMTTTSPVPGASLELLPDAHLPGEFSWAAGDARIAATLAGAAAAVQDAAAKVVTPPVRELVADRLRTWDGQPQGPSRAWADEAVAVLDKADRPAGLLAILTAFASYQVGKADVAAFRSTVKSGDEAVISLTAWASMAVARTIGSWLCEQAPDTA
jgi:Carboxymuconolactone decarboxylase family